MKKRIFSAVLALVTVISVMTFAVSADGNSDAMNAFIGKTFTSEDKTVTFDGTEFTLSDGSYIVSVPAVDLKYNDEMSDETRAYYSTEDEYNEIIFFLDVGEIVAVACYGDAFTDYENYSFDFWGTYTDPDREADGTDFYPWVYGDLSVYRSLYDEGSLCIYGNGAIPDRGDADVFPWDVLRENVTEIVIGDEITSIGQNAFKDFGTDGVFLSFYGEAVEEIGEGAFDGAKLGGSIYFPASVKKIGSRAFAGAECENMVFSGKPDEIASDAFDGVKTEVYTTYGEWDESEKQQYGGELTYKNNYIVHIEFMCDGESIGWQENTIVDGENFEFYVEDFLMGSGYVFDRAELTTGTAEGFDGSSTSIGFTPSDNVTITVYTIYDESTVSYDWYEDEDIDGEELINAIMGDEKAAKYALKLTTIITAVGIILFAGTVVGIFFIIRAAVKKKKKKSE